MNTSKQPECEHSDAHRRSFFSRLSIALGGFIGAIMTLPGVAFVLAPAFRKPPQKWRSVGAVDSFELGDTVLVSFEDSSPVPWAGVTAETGAWVRRTGEEDFIVFSINCRHLGCPVRWVEGANLFMCPCHGGVYNRDGSRAAGPPPEGLAKYTFQIQDGQLQIATSGVPLTSFTDSLD